MRYLLYPLIAANVLMCWWCAYFALQDESLHFLLISIVNLFAAWLQHYAGRKAGWL